MDDSQKLTSIKVFLPQSEKDEYHKICFEENVKMSADIRDYITERRNGKTRKAIIEAFSELMAATQRPSNAQIVKLARKLEIETEEVMQWCDRLFTSKQECRHG